MPQLVDLPQGALELLILKAISVASILKLSPGES
jgi:hypothetical protein